MGWDPDQYERFVEERLQPGRDLIGRMEVDSGLRVVDLGCGTGRLTRELADRLPGSDVVGIDRSEEMLAKAQPLARGGLRFEHGAIEDLEGRFDRIYSNAALHWIPDHRSLLDRLLAHLRPGGQIAFQVPSNSRHPVTRIRFEVMGEPPFREALASLQGGYGVLELHEYAERLFELGAERIQVSEVVYPHVLEDADAIVEWQKGTALLPVLGALDEDGGAEFVERFRQRLRERYPSRPVLFPFRRTFCSAFAPA